MHRQMERKRAEKYQNNLHMIDLPKQNQHIKFVSSLNEVKAMPQPEHDAHTEIQVNPNSKIAQQVKQL